jgi:hypothetical protein
LHRPNTDYALSRSQLRPRQRQLQEAFDIPVLDPVGVQLIEELLEGPLHPIMLMGTFISLSTVWMLKWKENCCKLLPTDAKLLSWTRSGKNVSPTGKQPVQAGDLIYLSSNHLEIDKLRQSLTLAQENDL